MTPHKKILLDVGGTFIKCSDGREIPVDSAGPREKIIGSLREAVADYTEAAVAIPGPFNYSKGTFLMKHKFAAVYGEDFCTLAGLPEGSAVFEHDVIAMLRGELSSGNARGYRRVAIVTLGTGLGFAMSIDGEILRNENGSPAVSIFSRPYKGGILEDYASKRGARAAYARALGYDPGYLSVKQIADKARAGEKAAIDGFLDMGGIIGSTISPILEEYGIECLVFGGQICRSFDLFETSLKAALPACVKYAGPISDFDNATFNGLRAM